MKRGGFDSTSLFSRTTSECSHQMVALSEARAYMRVYIHADVRACSRSQCSLLILCTVSIWCYRL